MKQLYLTLTLILAFFNTSFSQEIEWQKTIGGSLGDGLNYIEQTADGGYIMGGYSFSNISGDKTENCLGDLDYWIVKIDSVENIQWQNTIGGTDIDGLLSIQQTSDGGYILCGTSKSNISVDKTENCLGYNDYWIVKIDAFGMIQWQNTIGGSSYDVLISLDQTSDGGYILGGYSTSDISGDKTENSLGYWDYWIVKTDSLGIIQWQKTIGGSGGDMLNSIKQTEDDGYIIGGVSNSNISGDKSENSNGDSDYWIVKTDSLGNIQWQNTIGGSLIDFFPIVLQTNDGGYIIGGYSQSSISGDKSENSYGGCDYWIVKTDAFGTIQWQNTIGGAYDETLSCIIQTNDEGYLLGGYSQSNISGDKTENSNSIYDYWVVKINSQGNIQWQNAIGGNSSDVLKSINQTTDGGYILGGESNSDISGDKTEDCLGNIDYWIVKLNDQYNLVSGKVFADINGNSIQDSTEFPLSGMKIIEQNTGRLSFSEQDGKYSLSVLDPGNYTVYSQTINWYNPIPASHNAIFSGLNQIDSLNDFAYQPQGVFEDVSVTITPLMAFRSGINATYQINYCNNGNSAVAPTVIFYPDTNVTFQYSTLMPNTITIDSVIWILPSLNPFQTGSFVITVNVNIGVPIGTLINSAVHIEPYLTDDNQGNNNSNWEVYTSGSFDPNEILVSDATLTPAELSTSPWLDYIINFQNTGNDTAFTVKITNPIDTNKLNLSTIEFVNASHPVNLSWINYQRNMEFKFDNILLPDSNTNEPLSHGFVRYRIQPKTNLNIGDTVSNLAAIYFDFNEPVITNTATTVIVIPTGLSSAAIPGKLNVFPNPAANKINITGIKLENGKANLRVTDIYGKLIVEKTISSSTIDIEIQNLSSGLYLIQSGELRATFVKQ